MFFRFFFFIGGFSSLNLESLFYCFRTPTRTSPVSPTEVPSEKILFILGTLHFPNVRETELRSVET